MIRPARATLAVAALGVLLVGCGADSPADTEQGPRPAGFARVAATATARDGTVCELCLWVARTDDERRRGLMGVTDLAGADGMVFVYTAPSSGSFWMRGTPMPLSIAFFAADGGYVSSDDMTPCLEGAAASCPRYAAAGAFTMALEVPAGDLEELGIGPGSHLELGDDVETCPGG